MIHKEYSFIVFIIIFITKYYWCINKLQNAFHIISFQRDVDSCFSSNDPINFDESQIMLGKTDTQIPVHNSIFDGKLVPSYIWTMYHIYHTCTLDSHTFQSDSSVFWIISDACYVRNDCWWNIEMVVEVHLEFELNRKLTNDWELNNRMVIVM